MNSENKQRKTTNTRGTSSTERKTTNAKGTNKKDRKTTNTRGTDNVERKTSNKKGIKTVLDKQDDFGEMIVFDSSDKGNWLYFDESGELFDSHDEPVDISVLSQDETVRKCCNKAVSTLFECSSYDQMIKNFANNLRYLRKKNNFTFEELSEKLNVSRQYIGQIESLKKNPSLELICNIAKLFNTSVAVLTSTDINWKILFVQRLIEIGLDD